MQIEMPYNIEPRDHRSVRRYLDEGWRISDLQRLSDREALITFECPEAVAEAEA